MKRSSAAQLKQEANEQTFANAFVEAVRERDAEEREPYIWIDKILDETNLRMPKGQRAGLAGNYQRLAFFRNPNYVRDPLRARFS
jgi:hypothetical protein